MQDQKMVTIRSSCTVLPNQRTPNGVLWLSYMDVILGLRHQPTVYIYKAHHSHDKLKRMRDSLSEILVHFYPIAGRLKNTEGGGLELDCNAKGVTFLEAETNKTLQDYGDFLGENIKELVPIADYTKPLEELPLLLVQVTKFPDNEEALAIGLAFSHALCDGASAIHLINAWTKVARGEILEAHEMPFLDRTILKISHPLSPPRFDHPELKPYPLILGRSDNTIEKEKKIVAALLKLTAEQVEMLKKKANDEYFKEGSRPCSRFEAVSAHIWRCACKARELDENQPTVLRSVLDIRKRLNPPLPRNYFGNALAHTVATSHVGEITSNSLKFVAQKLREAIEVVDNEYIRSQQDVIRASMFDQNDAMKTPFHGNPNLHITSWMSMAGYEADFGWGKPIYFGLAHVCPQDRAYIILNPNGSINVSMHFQIAHMQLFKKFFYEDI